MTKEGTLLVVDDNRSILAALQLLLGNHFERVLTLPSPNQLISTLRREPVDVVLLDMNFTAGINTGNEGFYWLQEIQRNRPDVKVVLFTAYADIDLAVRAMRDGAVDFVVKPWDNERLVSALRNACSLARSQREVKRLKEIKRELTQEEPMFWGTSPAMMRIREIVEKVAATDANILITGENGTGKEMLAREIHNRSARHRELMVSVDMGAIPETLFESELFGHVKGAFTDARADRAGKFEAANGGTLFLDEIGNLPPHLQSKLLTALQSGRIVRVGSNTPVKVDIRLISATNRDLYGMVAEGRFREDLLYRINTIHIDLPPLRQRREDILPLAEAFLRRYAAKYGKAIEGVRRAGPERNGGLPLGGQHPRAAAHGREGCDPRRRPGDHPGDAAAPPRAATTGRSRHHDPRRDGALDDRPGHVPLQRQHDRGGPAAGHHPPDALQQDQTIRPMKRPKGIAYGPMIAHSGVLAAAALASGWLVARQLYPLLLVSIPLMVLEFCRILSCYGDSVRRVTFMFDAIDNDDLTFRFNENPSKVDSTMLNAALNRIREILLRTKLRAEERERYYQLIMECAQTGLITINDTGSVYQANGEALRIFGLQRMTHILQLKESAPEVFRALGSIRPGEKLRVSCITEAGEMALTLGCSEITLEKQRRRVVSVSDINSELNEMQVESWSKLTRILTHEIMNSLAPITSLSDTLLHIGKPLDSDIERGLDTISATSHRLMTFIEGFRRFTRIPEPQREPFEVRELIRQAVVLTAAEKDGVRIRTDIEPADTMIYADKAQLGQVTVNLLKNAREAVAGRSDGEIEIRSRIDAAEHVVIEISNNGGAIPTEVTENIFTPFFSTKPDGSGIGLSLSRRIMQLHGGSLRLTANTDRKVTFTLRIG